MTQKIWINQAVRRRRSKRLITTKKIFSTEKTSTSTVESYPSMQET
jgi:hypothetical protein